MDLLGLSHIAGGRFLSLDMLLWKTYKSGHRRLSSFMSVSDLSCYTIIHLLSFLSFDSHIPSWLSCMIRCIFRVKMIVPLNGSEPCYPNSDSNTQTAFSIIQAITAVAALLFTLSFGIIAAWQGRYLREAIVEAVHEFRERPVSCARSTLSSFVMHK